METIIRKKQTSFRLRPDLLEKLHSAAKREHKSLNGYVEGLLMDAVCDIPNRETLAAIDEIKSGKPLEVLDVDNLEDYIKSL